MPDANPSETYHVFGYATAQTLVHVLKNCGADLTREKPDEAGGKHQGPGTADDAPRHQAQYQRDALHADEPGTTHAVRRDAMEADREVIDAEK